MFILDRIDRELRSLERLELKFGLSSGFSDKYLLEFFLMFSFVCSGFLKRLLCPGIFIHDILKLRSSPMILQLKLSTTATLGPEESGR